MAILDKQHISSQDYPYIYSSTLPNLPIRRFSLDEYHRLGELNFFAPNERVELINGFLISMSPIRPKHAASVSRLARRLSKVVEDEIEIRSQSPIILQKQNSEPEPDVVIARPHPDNYETRHPTADDIYVVIEVSDSTLKYDQETKSESYAAEGIEEYWIVNLVDDHVEVYKKPTVLANGKAGYQQKKIYKLTQTITPQALPNCQIKISQIISKLNQKNV